MPIEIKQKFKTYRGANRNLRKTLEIWAMSCYDRKKWKIRRQKMIEKYRTVYAGNEAEIIEKKSRFLTFFHNTFTIYFYLLMEVFVSF